MPTNAEIIAKAHADRERCKEWLRRYIRPGIPKAFTKEDLRSVAIQDLGVSKSSFDFAWIWIIEESGCSEWYEPLPRRRTRRQ